MENDTDNDIRAAMAQLEAAPAAPVAVVETPPPADPVVQDPANVATQPGQARDEHGRFVTAEQTPPADPVVPAAPAQVPEQAPPGDTAGVPLDPAKPPSAWRPEAKAKWETLPPDLREEIVRREQATHQGYEKLKEQGKNAQYVYDHIGQYVEYTNTLNKHPLQYLDEVVSMEKALSQGNPAQKMETVLQICEQYGVPFKQILDQATGGKLAEMLAQAHAQHKTPPKVDPAIQKQLDDLRRFQEQTLEQQAKTQLDAMLADAASYPFLAEVQDTMAQLIERGHATDFKAAYEQAVWTNPELRARAIAFAAPKPDPVAARQAAAAAVTAPAAAGATVVTGNPVADADSTDAAIRAAMAQLAANGRA